MTDLSINRTEKPERLAIWPAVLTALGNQRPSAKPAGTCSFLRPLVLGR
jgi:hypothetical protein